VAADLSGLSKQEHLGALLAAANLNHGLLIGVRELVPVASGFLRDLIQLAGLFFLFGI